MSAIYAIIQATSHGWISAQVLGFGALAAVLMAAFLVARGADREPDHAAADPPPARPGQRQPRPRLPRHRHVLDVLPRRRCTSSTCATTARCRPARRSCRGRSPSRSSRRGSRRGWSAGSARCAVLMAGMASAVVGLLLFSTVGPHTAFFPTVFLACFADRPRHRQRVHAAADDRDGGRPRRRRGAGLRNHQRLPADQRRARTGRPQHDRRQPHEGPARRPPRR